MSTRSRIAIKNTDNTFTSIYCHHDGYLAGVGAELIQWYITEKKIRELMTLGDASSIGASISECVFYTRDRGENQEETKATESPDFKHLYMAWHNSSGEFLYLWKDGLWYWANDGRTEAEMKILLADVEKESVDEE